MQKTTLLSLTLLAVVSHAQTYNYYGSDGVFRGSAQTLGNTTFIYGENMQPEGFITSSDVERPAVPMVLPEPLTPEVTVGDPTYDWPSTDQPLELDPITQTD